MLASCGFSFEMCKILFHFFMTEIWCKTYTCIGYSENLCARECVHAFACMPACMHMFVPIFEYTHADGFTIFRRSRHGHFCETVGLRIASSDTLSAKRVEVQSCMHKCIHRRICAWRESWNASSKMRSIFHWGVSLATLRACNRPRIWQESQPAKNRNLSRLISNLSRLNWSSERNCVYCFSTLLLFFNSKKRRFVVARQGDMHRKMTRINAIKNSLRIQLQNIAGVFALDKRRLYGQDAKDDVSW